MALRLDQIKKAKAPQRKDSASSFTKEKTLAPFEAVTPSSSSDINHNDLIGVQLEHKEMEIESESATKKKSPLNRLNASPEVDPATPAPAMGNSSTTDLYAADFIGAQLEHKDHFEGDEIRAQLEHNNDLTSHTIRAQLEHSSIDKGLDISNRGRHKSTIGAQNLQIKIGNKSTIRAQSDPDPKAIKSTIRAQASELYKFRIENDKSTIRAQLEHKTAGIRAQLEHNSDLNRAQLEHIKSTDQSTNRVSNRAQSESGKIRHDYQILSGHELKLLKLIHRNCVETGSRTSSRFNNQTLANVLGIKAITLKTIVKRVVDKGFLIRETGKRGRGGFLQFTIGDELYSKMLFTADFSADKFADQSIRAQGSEIKSTDKSTDKSTTASSSSSNYYNTNTTTEGGEPWNEIVIPPFLQRQGFSVTHAKQVLGDKDNVFSVEELQESLDHFALDLEKGLLKINSSSIGYFMGIVRKKRVPYISILATQQLEAEIDAYQKRQSAAKDLLKNKVQAELAEKFEQWMESLTQEERNQIAPPNNVMEPGSAQQKMSLRAFFMNTYCRDDAEHK